MSMQVILDSSFARPGSAPIRGGEKGEFRDWTKGNAVVEVFKMAERGVAEPFFVKTLILRPFQL